MFTLKQIYDTRTGVKTGADFPAFVREIKKLGVSHYTCYVTDGHIDYHGTDGSTLMSPAQFALRTIADTLHAETFKADLKDHQQGNSDFPTFIARVATYGIARWTVSTTAMTCTYYDKAGNVALVEAIPS